jgi:uncharacterized protein (DUF1697 family)
MPAYVALLRGINVGGKNKLPMADLAAIFSDLGATNVRTYIQSGNVLFAASPEAASGLPAAVAAAIEARLGLRVPVVLRSASELEAAIEANPFLAAGVSAEQLHVAFLADVPAAERVAALDAARSAPDAFEVRGREVYLHLPNGVARTKLTNDYFDRALATTSTVRNWKTVTTLASMLRG